MNTLLTGKSVYQVLNLTRNKLSIGGILIVAGLGVAPLPLRAQGSPSANTRATPAHDAAEIRDQFFREKIQPLASVDAQAALDAAGKFLTDNPHMDAWNRLQFFATLGTTLYFSSPTDKRTQTAELVLPILDKGLIQATDTAGPYYNPWPDQILILVNAKANLLLSEKKWAEVDELFKSADPFALRSDSSTDPRLPEYLRNKVKYLKGQNQGPKIPEMLTHFAATHVSQTRRVELPLCEIVVEQLIDNDAAAEALSWAKIGFLYCPFEDQAISRATQMLTKAWMANDFARDKVAAFAAAQTDAKTPNPLDNVPLPVLDTEVLKAQLDDAKTKQQEKLALLLLTGNSREAMMQARHTLLADPKSQQGLLDVALVFKATDGDVVRANEFLTFYQTNQGDNPMTDFIKNAAPPVTK